MEPDCHGTIDIDLIDYYYEFYGMPMKNPPHPGDLIITEIIEPLGLDVSKASKVLKVRRATLFDLLHGKASLTPEMHHLLRMQLAYDVARTRAIFPLKRYVPVE